MELSRPCRPSYQPFTSPYSSLSVKSRLYAIPARTSSFLASSVPVVAKAHQASLDAFSVDARRSSKEAIKSCTLTGEIVTLARCGWGKSAAVAPVCAGAAGPEVERDDQHRYTGRGELHQPWWPGAPDDERRHEDERHAC